MSKLIQLRQRIKAIETIKKITHAMRLIAMSTHSHLKSAQEPLTAYNNTVKKIFDELIIKNPEWHNKIIHPNPKTSSKTLLIVIGSQKGLCGSFNTMLFKKCSNFILESSYKPNSLDIIAVGQKAIDYAHRIGPFTIRHSYATYNAKRLSTICQEIVHTIMHAPIPYRSVIVASNHFKSFFAQRPEISNLLPIQAEKSNRSSFSQDLLWEQSPQEILTALLPQYLNARIHYLLFQSLYAEHAARFVSMDGATRNADSILESTKLEYNKLRQAKITKELTELSGSYS